MKIELSFNPIVLDIGHLILFVTSDLNLHDLIHITNNFYF